MRAASSTPRRPVAALALPELATTARSESSAQRSWHRITGAASTPERVKRAALTVPGVSETSRPRSVPAGRLQAGGDPGRAEALRQPARRVDRMLGKGYPAGRGRRLGHVSPSLSSRPNIRLRFCTACDAAPFHRLSIAENTSTRPVRSSRWTEMRQ